MEKFGGVCGPFSLFAAKLFDFPYPMYDLTQKSILFFMIMKKWLFFFFLKKNTHKV